MTAIELEVSNRRNKIHEDDSLKFHQQWELPVFSHLWNIAPDDTGSPRNFQSHETRFKNRFDES